MTASEPFKYRLPFKTVGHTPASVLHAELFAHDSVNPLPVAPPYGIPAGMPDTAYLVKDEAFNIGGRFTFTETVWNQITAGQRNLWLLGYVDYRDAFGKSRRAGYARHLAPGIPGNNLPFETREGYNYDRKLD